MASKPGWKTTEYWTTILGFVITSVILAGGFIQNETVIQGLTIVSGMLGGSYTVGRSLVKAAEAKRDAIMSAEKKA